MSDTLHDFITFEALQETMDPQNFAMAQTITDVRVLEQSPTRIVAVVNGQYTSMIEFADMHLGAGCTCDGPQDRWCEHVIAVALVVAGQTEAVTEERSTANDSWPRDLDKDAIFNRLIKSGTRDQLRLVLRAIRDSLQPDDHNVMNAALLVVGTPQELGIYMASFAGSLHNEAKSVVTATSQEGEVADLDAIVGHWNGFLGLVATFLERGKGKQLLFPIVISVNVLCELCRVDRDFVPLLRQLLDLHLAYVRNYGMKSTEIIQWLENNIARIAPLIPDYDPAPYAEFVNRDELHEAMARNSDNEAVSLYFMSMFLTKK